MYRQFLGDMLKFPEQATAGSIATGYFIYINLVYDQYTA
jgi:hypothetical protein